MTKESERHYHQGPQVCKIYFPIFGISNVVLGKGRVDSVVASSSGPITMAEAFRKYKTKVSRILYSWQYDNCVCVSELGVKVQFLIQ